MARALWLAVVVGCGTKPYGIFRIIKHIHPAFLALWTCGTVGLKHPAHLRVFKRPKDGIPDAGTVVVPELEIVGVDLEFGGVHDPMGKDVFGVDGVDFGGVGRVVDAQVEMEDAVAT